MITFTDFTSYPCSRLLVTKVQRHLRRVWPSWLMLNKTALKYHCIFEEGGETPKPNMKLPGLVLGHQAAVEIQKHLRSAATLCTYLMKGKTKPLPTDLPGSRASRDPTKRHKKGKKTTHKSYIFTDFSNNVFASAWCYMSLGLQSKHKV